MHDINAQIADILIIHSFEIFLPLNIFDTDSPITKHIAPQQSIYLILSINLNKMKVHIICITYRI